MPQETLRLQHVVKGLFWLFSLFAGVHSMQLRKLSVAVTGVQFFQMQWNWWSTYFWRVSLHLSEHYKEAPQMHLKVQQIFLDTIYSPWGLFNCNAHLVAKEGRKMTDKMFATSNNFVEGSTAAARALRGAEIVCRCRRLHKCIKRCNKHILLHFTDLETSLK